MEWKKTEVNEMCGCVCMFCMFMYMDQIQNAIVNTC